jgi:hemoglobin/transferrin/lactoferrin receptor protein
MFVHSIIKFKFYPNSYYILVSILVFCVGISTAVAQQTDTLNEMVVSANRNWEKKIDIPQFIKVLTTNTIQQIKPLTNADLLEQTGSAYVQKSQQGGGSPILRGFEANKILLVIDGVRMNNAIYRAGHLQNILRVDPFMLERIEVVYGPSSVMYGSDALGGVIHLMTKKPKLNQSLAGEALYRFNSVNTGNTFHINLQKGFKHIGILTGISFNEFGHLMQGLNRTHEIGDLGLRKIYQSNLNGKDVLIQNNNPNLQIGSAYTQLDVTQSVIIEKNNRYKHLLNFQISRTGNVPRYDRLSELKNDTPVFGAWYYGPEIRVMANYQIENNLKNIWADNWKWNTAYQWIEESRMTRNFGKSNENNRIENVQVMSSTIDFYKQIQKHEIRYGIDVQWNDVQSKAFAKNQTTGIQNPISTRYPDNGSQLLLSGVYISHTKELSNKLIFTESMRLSAIHLKARFKDKSFYSFLPDQFAQNYLGLCGNIGMVWMPSQKIRITFQSATGFRAPNIDDINKIFDSQSGKQLIVPNSLLKPEITWTNEAGITFKPNKKTTIQTQCFQTVLFDAMVIAPIQINQLDSQFYDGRLTRTYSPQNKQLATIYGTAVELNYELYQNLKFDASMVVTIGKILTDSIMPLDHIPPIYGRIGLNYHSTKIDVRLWTVFNGQKAAKDYYLNGEDNFQYATANGLPAWYTLNIQLDWFPDKKKKIQLSSGIENCLDLNYRTFGSGISAPGRNFKLGVAIKI